MMIYTQRRSKEGGLRLAERGFTLMELVIVVAVIGILAAIAIPTYQDSVRKSRRADAKGILLQAAQWMERRYTTNNCYDDPCGSGTAPALDTTLTVSPTGCSLAVPDCYYTITLTAVAQNSYTLSAAPIATTNQITDRCQTLTLDNTGAKGVANGATLSVSECWR